MPANLITLAHFSVSAAMSFPKSAGEPGSSERAEFGKAACRVPIEHRKQKLASSFATRIPASFSMSTMKETAKSFSSTPVSSAAKASSRNGLAHPIARGDRHIG